MSMGRCGTLAIGMAHGDIFAAARACVPAGTEYASSRTGGFAQVNGVLPDPPVLVDFSSQSDGWSKTQDPLVSACRTERLPLVLSWGPFAHCGDSEIIGKYPPCEVALAYPWLEIRKDEAYPVFSRASCDQVAPWPPGPTGGMTPGKRMPIFVGKFRSIHLPSSSFSSGSNILRLKIHLRCRIPRQPISHCAGSNGSTSSRRKPILWQLARDGRTLSSGTIRTDKTLLLTIPHVELEMSPTTISLQVLD